MRLVAIAFAITIVLGLALYRGSPAPSACNLPPRTCTVGCAELVMVPARGPGYEDVPLEDERTEASSTSYLRRDLMMAIQYAAARVACVARGWPGNGGPIALGDMSERNGATPGTRLGHARHPPFTHTGGRDIDIAYYQRGTPNNHIRPICDHSQRGIGVFHCVAPPTKLDAWRTALFIGVLLEEPNLRIIGVDGMAAPPLLAALRQLCSSGLVSPAACANDRVRYETRDTGRGWFYSHHHHLHVSWNR